MARRICTAALFGVLALNSIACGGGAPRSAAADLMSLSQPTPDPTLDAVVRALPRALAGIPPTATPTPVPAPKQPPKLTPATTQNPPTPTVQKVQKPVASPAARR